MEREERFGVAHVALLVLTAAFLASLAWFSTHGGTVAAAPDDYTVAVEHSAAEEAAPEMAPVNINTATEAELEKLPGVGPVLARAIVDYRAEHGAFGSVEELLEVNGIGEAKLESFRNDITLGEGAAP